MMHELFFDLNDREQRLERALIDIMHQPPGDNARCRNMAESAVNRHVDRDLRDMYRRWAADDLRSARTMRRMAKDYGDKDGFYARSVMRHMRIYGKWKAEAMG